MLKLAAFDTRTLANFVSLLKIMKSQGLTIDRAILQIERFISNNLPKKSFKTPPKPIGKNKKSTKYDPVTRCSKCRQLSIVRPVNTSPSTMLEGDDRKYRHVAICGNPDCRNTDFYLTIKDIELE